MHLRPTAPVAADALLPGDPGRALALAQDLLVSPQMSNHHRGLWGYYGETAAGRPLTIQATGVGGPSAAIVLHELAELGIKRAIRVGTCRATPRGPDVGAQIVADDAIASDGTSRALGATELVSAAQGLTEALATEAPEAVKGRVATVDLFYSPDGPRRGDCAAIEMEAAPLFALGPRFGIEVACILLVVAGPREERLEDSELAAAELEIGRAAAATLVADPAPAA